MIINRMRLLLLTLAWIVGISLVLARPGQAQDGPDPALVQQGAQLYSENCAVCHGERGEGRVGATLAKNWPSIKPDLTIKHVIANGVPGSPMPAWSTEQGGPLTEAQIDALVTYLLTWETNPDFPTTPQPTATSRPPITPIPEISGDPNRGAVLFDSNCKVCHGENGAGRIGATLAKSWPGIRPDLSIRTIIANGVPGSPMPAWSLAQGGVLTDGEIDDLVSFIMTLPDLSQPATQPTPEPTPSKGLGAIGGIAVTLFLFGALILLILVAQRPRKR